MSDPTKARVELTTRIAGLVVIVAVGAYGWMRDRDVSGALVEQRSNAAFEAATDNRARIRVIEDRLNVELTRISSQLERIDEKLTALKEEPS